VPPGRLKSASLELAAKSREVPPEVPQRPLVTACDDLVRPQVKLIGYMSSAFGLTWVPLGQVYLWAGHEYSFLRFVYACHVCVKS
jgi:hypothetical protein